MPHATSLRLAENKCVRTRILSDLASMKLQTENTLQSPKFSGLVGSRNRSKSDKDLLLSTLGVVQTSTFRQLPKDIAKLKDVLMNKKELDKLSLGSPATREDTNHLADWLNSMLKSVLSDNNADIEGLLEKAVIIYEVCFHEIVRQVSVQCIERGELIALVWKAYLGLMEKALKISKALQEYYFKEFTNEKESIHKQYKEQISIAQKATNEYKFEVERLQRGIRNKEEEINHLAKKDMKVAEKVQILQKQYETCKRELIFTQEDNRVLKAKLMSTNVEFIENSQGIIEPRLANVQKIKRKSEAELMELLKLDPLLSAQMATDEKISSLKRSISRYEELANEAKDKLDFIEKNVGTDLELVEQSTQTEGDSPTRKRREDSDSSILQLMQLKVEGIMDISDFSDYKEEFDTLRSSTLTHSQEYLTRFQTKIDQVNKLLEQIRSNIQKNAPSAYQKDMLTNFYSSVTDSISKMQGESETEHLPDESFRRGNKNSRKLTFIQPTKIIKKQTIDLLSTAVNKVINTPQQKLKSVVFKRTLMRLIAGFYEIKMKKFNEGDKRQDMGQIVIEYLYNHYGMPKVVESKFTQILSSCIKYKDIRRVHLFGRFLKLFNTLSIEDLHFYIESVTVFKQNYYTESMEEMKVPYDKVLDWYRFILPAVLSESERLKVKVFIETYKQTDPVTRVPTLEVDSLLEFVIDILQQAKYENLDFLRSIYEAGDVISI
jgi:hypothetical protein